jgi:hypothetical protein
LTTTTTKPNPSKTKEKRLPRSGKEGDFLRLRRKGKRQTARYAGKKKGQKNAPKARKGFGASQKG